MSRHEQGPIPAAPDFPSGGGEMGALMRSIDWSATPIGAAESWTPALRMMVRMLLPNRFPQLLWWGPQYCQIYNDAYRPILGDKHPRSMGQRASECFPEIWPIIGPLIDTPFHGGPATWMEDLQLEYIRYELLEEAHFTIACSPVPDDTAPGRIGGVLATVQEITEQVVGERRLRLLRDLGAEPAKAKTAVEACSLAAGIFSRNSKDIPFAFVYLRDGEGGRARLAAVAGVAVESGAAPVEIDLASPATSEQLWPLDQAMHDDAMQVVGELQNRLGKVPPGPWASPPRSAAVLPIRSDIANQPEGFLVFGISSRLRFDDAYRGFCELSTNQVATAIASANRHEREQNKSGDPAGIDPDKTTFFRNVSHEFRTPPPDLHEELRKEIIERQRAEMESLALRDAQAAELEAMARLQELSTRVLASTELKPLMEEVLDATMALHKADFGDVQLYNAETGGLELVSQRGFQRNFLDRFAVVKDASTSCGRALRTRQRVIIEDVQTDAAFAPHRQFAASSGFRAVQSTPLFNRGGEPLGAISTHFRQPHIPSERKLRLTDLYAMHAAEMIARKQDETAVLRYQQNLRTLTAKLIEAQETGNKFLARELHDVFSQKLAVLGMDLAALASGNRESSQALRDRLLEMTARIGALAKDIHRISRQLHPAILDDLGLAVALRNECAAFAEQYGIAADLNVSGLPRILPGDVSLCLLRVAQECLRNVAKHAQATEVRIALSGGIDGIEMEIADNGQGFHLESSRGKGGLGLISMEERARLAGGIFSIRSQPGKGTLAKVVAPLRQRIS